jgi:CBS domain containing-hemolysin-like protein
MSVFFLLFVGFVFSAFFSGVETGSYSLNRIRLRHDIREKKRSALRLEALLVHPHRFVFTMLIGNNLAIYLVSQQTTQLYLNRGMSSEYLGGGFLPWNAETAATVTLMIPLFLLAEMGPKNLFRTNADRLMCALSGPMRLVSWMLFPLAWPLERFFRLFLRDEQMRRSDWGGYSKVMLMEQLAEGRQRGVISSYQSRMMDHVIAMHQLPVRLLMRSVKRSLTLPEEATVGDLRRAVGRRSGAELFLMKQQQVVGIIGLQEVIARQLPDEAPLRPLAQDALSIEMGRNIKSAFYRLRNNPRHVAAVVDGRGHLVGSIRIDDIARYIAKR